MPDTTFAQELAGAGIPRTLAMSGTPVSVTGTNAETTFATITIPAGAIGPSGFVEVCFNTSMTGSTNQKTLRLRLNGTEINTTITTTAAATAIRNLAGFNNAGSASSQVSFGGTATGLGQVTIIRTNINTAAATTLTITGQIVTTTETLTLESYFVRLTYGA